MSRTAKNKQMAEHIAKMSAAFPAGKVVGVAGNTLEHANELIKLVHETARKLGLKVDHVTFKPIGGDELLKAANAKKH